MKITGYNPTITTGGAVNAQVSSDFTYSMPVGETTLQVRFIDRSKNTGYHLGSATIPTIIYNY
jgi:hypothetical protein